MKILDRKVSLDTDGDLPECISSAEEMLLFDIETTGLKKEYSRIYLIGCGYLETDGWHIKQYLAGSEKDEEEILKAFAGFAQGFKLLTTFNGEGFDIPFTDFKSGYYGLPLCLSGLESLDIYRQLKGAKKLIGAKSLKQKAVEELCGIKRDDELDGGRLIPYYYEYERTHSPDIERLLLLHNFEDVLGMLKILPALSYTQIIKGEFEVRECVCSGSSVTIGSVLKDRLPAPFKNGKISACGRELFIDLDVKDGKVFLPLKDVKDYYYLPEEDRVIHKDLATFVDKAHRRRATKEDCFLKVETEKLKGMSREDLKSFAMNIIYIYR